MAPPFYSKNGVGSVYSRLGELLLRSHFAAVWPEENSGATAFVAWWEHSLAHGLCYSFECVAPRVAGDHGATPSAAYLVLTCVTHTGRHAVAPSGSSGDGESGDGSEGGESGDGCGAGGVLSPSQMLVLATSWRLPLNQSWFVPWAFATAVESRLHAARWTLTDSAADEMLAGVGVEQRFLSHQETQGEVLEGFVLMALDESVERLSPLMAAYEGAVGGRREAAAAAAADMGRLCAADGAKERVLARWAAVAMDEPRVEQMSQESAWEMACRGRGPLPTLFKLLRTLYPSKVKLKTYSYRGATQIQIDVRDDQIFYGWPMHMKAFGAAPLFRGMVVSFDGHVPAALDETIRSASRVCDERCFCNAKRPLDDCSTTISQHAGDLDAGLTKPDALPKPVRILGISKLKCLNYLQRTFGVRNLLPTLLNRGVEAYMGQIELFYQKWSVPEEHRPRLSSMFLGWAHEVAAMSPSERQSLERGEYLQLFEAYLGGARRTSHVPEALAPLRHRALLLVNLTGAKMPSQVLADYVGLLVPARQARAPPLPGTYRILTQPPGWPLLRCSHSLLVLVFPPPAHAQAFLHKMQSQCERLPAESNQSADVRFFVPAPDVSEWHRLVASLPPPKGSYATMDAAGSTSASLSTIANCNSCQTLDASLNSDAAQLPTRLVMAVIALPPGGGKSTLFAHLGNAGWAVASSDLERSRNGNFDETLAQLLYAHPAVCYDKNVPNAEGIAKMCRVLSGIAQRHRIRIRVQLVVPQRLELETAWQRICERKADDLALNTSMGEAEALRVFRNVFFEPCAQFLPVAKALPGAVVSAAFWEGREASALLASKLAVLSTAAPELSDVEHALSSSRAIAANPAGSYVAAEIPGTRLHVTLVPRPDAYVCDGAGRYVPQRRWAREAAVGRLRRVEGQSVGVRVERYVLARETATKKQLGLWQVSLPQLPEALHYAPVRHAYHVTDLAALNGCSAADAFFRLNEFLNGDVLPGWTVEALSVDDDAHAQRARGHIAAVITQHA